MLQPDIESINSKNFIQIGLVVAEKITSGTLYKFNIYVIKKANIIKYI